MPKKKVTWAEVLGQAIPSLPTSFKVPTSKGLVGPPAPRSVITVKHTPTKTVVTRKTEVPRSKPKSKPTPRDYRKTFGATAKPFDFGVGKPTGVPGQAPRRGGPLLPTLGPEDREGGWLSGAITGTVKTAGRIGESLLPLDDGRLADPGAIRRAKALGTTGAVALVEGGKWAGKEIYERAQEDTDQLGVQLEEFQRAVVGLEKKKGRKLNEAETRQLAAGMLPTGVLSNQNLINFAAGAGGVAYGLGGAAVNALTPGADLVPNADPMKVVKDIAKLGVDVTVGTGLWIAAMSRPDLTWDQRKAMWAEMPKGIRAEYTKFFGRGLSGLEAFHRAAEDPVRAALLYPTPVAAGAQGARIMTIAAFGLRRGVSLKDAARLARDPEKMRTLTYTERAPKGSGVETVKTKVPVPYGWSSSVAVRPFQRGYDVATKVMDVIPGVRRAPISMSNRAARAIGKGTRMSKTRRGAEVQAHFRNIEQFLNERNRFGRKKNKHFATTLAALVQKPDGFTDAEWEGAVIQNMKNMLADPERMDLPGDVVSPAEQRLINRIARYDKREQADKARKRGLTMRRVYEHQQRWGENLGAIIKDREALHDEWLALEHNTDLMPRARDDEYARLEGEMGALDAQAQVMREKLAEISVDQAPITSPRREQAKREMEDLIFFQDYPAAVNDALLAGDAVARSWAKASGKDPADWWELRDVRRVEGAEDIPLEAYAQTRETPEGEPSVPFNLNRTIPPEQAADNLRRVKGGDLYKPHEGLQQSRKGYRTVRGRRVPVFGRITPEAYAQRMKVLVPDQTERDNLARWYRRTGPSLLPFFNADTEKILRGFAVSQANASPAGGITAVLRVYDKIRRGEADTVTNSEISTVAESIRQALEGTHVDKGMKAKLHDFADSIEGKSTRTWMGDDPRGGWPVANDVHAIRDLGYIDAKLVGRLLKPEPGAMFKRGFKESEFVRDSGGSPGVHQYERMREQYEEITAYFNKTNFDGRNDWTPSEVQALGWSAIQRLHGATPEDMAYAVAANTRRVNLEVTKGMSGIGDDLTLEEATTVANALEPMVRALIDDTEGLWFGGEIETMVSAYEGATNASLHFNVLGSPEATHTLVDRLSEAFDQWDVWGTRESSSTGSKPTLLVRHPDLADPAKAVALYQELFRTDPKRFAGFAQTTDEGLPAISLIMPGEAVTKKTLKARTEELHKVVEDAGHTALGARVDLRARLANTQIISKEWRSNVPSEMGRVERARSERAVHDPLATEARRRLEDAVGEVRAGRGLDPGDTSQGLAGPPRNQSRLNDTLGATQLLDSATGERIIWLTEHADFSTVMHELLGHAAEEMKLLHPEEFASVERVIGKTLEEWTVAEHEQFATWFERYLYEGHAPTPEMVPVFDRSKQYMRTIYGPLRRQLGGRIPQQTRDLFDHYLGGWDSESSTRIAMSMGHFDPSDSPWAGARSAAQGELATLQKRNRTRRFNQSVEGMMEKLKVLEKKADEANEAERELLAAEIIRTQAEIVLRSDKRVKNLTSKVGDMEKALTRDPNNRRFAGALESAKFMMEDRERILREAFGDEDFDEMFSNRRDLLANYLVQHGLLQPDFQKGTGTYFPMKLDEGFLQSLKLPMVPASNRVIGKTQRAMVGVHHRNEMIRWQAGDWSADPAVLQLAHARAMSYQFVLEVRETMHAMGRKLTAAERNDPKRALPSGGYVVNLKGTPLSPDMKAATRGMTNTTTVDNLDDGLFGDNEKLESTLKDFFRNSIVDIEDMPSGFSLADDDLRFISKNAVNKIFRPVSLNLGGKAWDWASTAARFSLIYANMPGYMITNLAGNLVFLTAQQGPNWIPRWVFYGKMLKNDDYFRARVAAEGGMLPAFSAVTRGRNFGQVAGERLMRGERAWLGFESKVDEWPRMIAWMAEANKKGYWSKESMLRLLDGKTAKTRRDREYVAERTNQHMIDFTYRVGDRERATLGRLLFIWPYIRGATAMPFWYGKNYPARTALMAQLALQQRTYQEAIAGDLPPGREDLYFYSRKGEEGVGAGAQGNVLGTRYFNPAGPVPDEIQMASDLVSSAFGRKPDNLSARLASLLNVNVENTIGLVTGRDAFGRDISAREQVLNPYGIADSLIPFERYIRAAFDERYTPRAFREGEGDTPLERVTRSVVRVPQQTVSIDWLNASAQSAGEKTTEEKIKLAVAANQKHFHRIEGANTVYPRSLRKQVAAKVIYDDRVYALEREEAAKAQHIPKRKDDGTWDFGYHADDYDKAVVAWAVIQQQFPEVIAHHNAENRKIGRPPIISPNDKLLAERMPPRSYGGLKYSKVYVDLFNKILKARPGPKGIAFASKYDTLYEKKLGVEQYRGEKKAGVYRGHEAARAERLRKARAEALRGG